jgi:hypothetical protein
MIGNIVLLSESAQPVLTYVKRLPAGCTFFIALVSYLHPANFSTLSFFEHFLSFILPTVSVSLLVRVISDHDSELKEKLAVSIVADHDSCPAAASPSKHNPIICPVPVVSSTAMPILKNAQVGRSLRIFSSRVLSSNLSLLFQASSPSTIEPLMKEKGEPCHNCF